MNRKQLDAVMDTIIDAVMKNNQLSKEEATTFVGVALRRNADAFLATVVIPVLTVAAAPAVAS